MPNRGVAAAMIQSIPFDPNEFWLLDWQLPGGPAQRFLGATSMRCIRLRLSKRSLRLKNAPKEMVLLHLQTPPPNTFTSQKDWVPRTLPGSSLWSCRQVLWAEPKLSFEVSTTSRFSNTSKNVSTQNGNILHLASLILFALSEQIPQRSYASLASVESQRLPERLASGQSRVEITATVMPRLVKGEMSRRICCPRCLCISVVFVGIRPCYLRLPVFCLSFLGIKSSDYRIKPAKIHEATSKLVAEGNQQKLKPVGRWHPRPELQAKTKCASKETEINTYPRWYLQALIYSIQDCTRIIKPLWFHETLCWSFNERSNWMLSNTRNTGSKNQSLFP